MKTPAVEQVSESTARELAAALRERLDGEVRFDHGSRALYATDGSLYREVPLGVVVPRSVADVEAAVALCREADAPLMARGAGTSLAGQCCNVAVVMDFSKYLNRIIELDPDARRARVQPGVILDHLRSAAEQHHLTFGPDPSTHDHNTLGGMIGNNSCGVHSVMAGRTADNIHALDILTYDGTRMRVGATGDDELERIIAGGGRPGEIYAGLRDLRDRYAGLIRARYPRIPRRVSGYNLDELLPEKGFHVARALVGSEGTCAIALEAELNLVPSPPYRCLLILGYDSVYATGDHVPDILGFRPTGLEGVDDVLMQAMQGKGMHPDAREALPEGSGWLLVEFGGQSRDEARGKAEDLLQHLQAQDNAPTHKLLTDPEEQARFWKLREAGLPATSRGPNLGDTFPGWEDAAVPPERVGSYLRDFRSLLHRYGYEAALYGHFGDGCIHCRINFNLRTEEGVNHWQAFMKEAAELVVRYDGSLSGEHGDGQVRAELLPHMFGEQLMEGFRTFKTLWDPRGRMNPGKIVDPYPMTSSLRVGPDTQPALIPTVYDYPEDDHCFFKAANRCVGVGNCRRHSGGVMCPSYRGTGDEQHSTRGRARLLFEMISGRERDRGWRSDAVHDALDLCLACKGCKRDCPVHVDMATYKSEFMAHYYRHRLRPRAAYSMGLIWWWSRLASTMPRLTNAALHAPGLSRAIKWAGGIAQERSMPRYAAHTFRHWFRHRERRNAGAPRVVLWPDTFNNFFWPQTLKAAVRVLEAAGHEVLVPGKPLCCARPLYAEGMMTLARHQLGEVLDDLADAMQARLPLVGIEPSCVSSFRDELPQLFPADERAHYLAQNTFLLGEYLSRGDWRPPPLARSALVQLHCHHHGSLDPGSDQPLFDAMGLEAQTLDAGCCGLGGPFGFNAKHYDVAQRIGEQQVLPAMREAEEGTLLITNGFSCREQILQSTGRPTLNLSEVLELALDGREGAPASQGGDT